MNCRDVLSSVEVPAYIEWSSAGERLIFGSSTKRILAPNFFPAIAS